MTNRHVDGSAGDADYGTIGAGYTTYRRPDPRIAGAINAALSDARTIINVGAGAGSYEPIDRVAERPAAPPMSARNGSPIRAMRETRTMRAATWAPACLSDTSKSGRRDRYDRWH